MKIAIIVNPLITVPPEQYGGIERIVYMLIQGLVKHGHNVTLYANEHSLPGCKLIGYHESARYGIADLVKINLLTGKIAYQGYDIVHTFGRMSNILSLMRSQIPKLVSYQLPPTLSQVQKAVSLARRGTIQFTGCSNYITDQIASYGAATTIYNGVDLKEYDYNESIPTDAPLVFLGRIQEEKGTSIAIRIAQLTGNKLIIAGNIPNEVLHQQYFEGKVKPFIDQQQIKYIGPVNNAQKNDLLRNAKALLMPVTWDEPFGIVMAEALACGTPVIGFNRGAIPEVVTQGINGFVCNSQDDMVDAVSRIDSISRLSCREIARQKFDAPVIVEQYEKLYTKFAGKH